jgi:hypothetical protein
MSQPKPYFVIECGKDKFAGISFTVAEPKKVIWVPNRSFLNAERFPGNKNCLSDAKLIAADMNGCVCRVTSVLERL